MESIETKVEFSGKPGQGTGYVWPAWYPELLRFRESSRVKSLWQVVNTLAPYLFCWWLMIRSIQTRMSYAVTLALGGVAAAFLVRIFILFHDCVHGSFFKEKAANTFFGYCFGVMVFTPFEDWRFSHLRHHATYANLDSRGFGDIWTLTRREFEQAAKVKQWAYRLFRHPLVMMGLGAVFSFLIRFRIPTRKTHRKERSSVFFTNLVILIVAWLVAHYIGWWTFLMVQLPVIWFAGALGIWLFYVQHQFEGVYWARKEEWDPLRAAMDGSSFYKLPAVLRWFSGNIGFHHIHHLGPRIPNYRLKECYDAIPALQEKTPLTLWKSLATMRLKVWDEERKQLIEFQ